MMEELLGRLRVRGSPGVHLGMSAVNQNAHRFYLKLGFSELASAGEGDQRSITMGKRLAT
jgi:ribosomal protein S18 acetylase RimI-like enzyme